MLISCWSVKGGVGTTVVSVSLALVLARRHPAGVLLVDLAGDVPAAMGVREPGDPGLTGWVAAGAAVPADALGRLEVEVVDRVALLPRGTGSFPAGDRLDSLAGLLAADPRPTVVDCGRLPESGAAVVAASATHSLLVTRPCYLALRRATSAPLRPSGVVLVAEAGRVLTRVDVEQVVGAPVVAEVAVEPGIARAIDAGLLASRLPRSISRALHGVVSFAGVGS